MLNRLQKGIDGVSQVRAMRDHLRDIEGQQLFVVGVHGRRCRGWHLNCRIVRLRHEQIVITAKFLWQRGPQFLSLFCHDLTRVQIHVIIILAGAAIVATARGDDRCPFEKQRGIPLRKYGNVYQRGGSFSSFISSLIVLNPRYSGTWNENS